MDQRLNSMSHELVHPSDQETEGRSAHLHGFNYRLQFTGHLSITGMNPVHEANQRSGFNAALSQFSVKTEYTRDKRGAHKPILYIVKVHTVAVCIVYIHRHECHHGHFFLLKMYVGQSLYLRKIYTESKLYIHPLRLNSVVQEVPKCR